MFRRIVSLPGASTATAGRQAEGSPSESQR